MSKESREKISIAAKKRYSDKKKHPMYGKAHSSETKAKISKSREKFVGKNSSNWRGGKIIVGGYIYIFSPEHPNRTKDNYICEHRLVMEKKLSRYLDKKEIVHHMNHNRLDNRVDNLMLLPSIGKHNGEHPKVRNKLGRFT